LFHAYPNWDIIETTEKRKGQEPLDDILDFDVMINCIFLSGPMPPFLTKSSLAKPRNLSVIADVSCDPHSPFNPLPIYNEITTLQEPTRLVDPQGSSPKKTSLEVVAIDHLPTFLPVESSTQFSKDLLPHLLQLDSDPIQVWSRAEEKFLAKMKEALST